MSKVTTSISPAATMESPCVRICVIDNDTGRCTGCQRSLDEIARWSSMSGLERRRIMAELPNRAGGPRGR